VKKGVLGSLVCMPQQNVPFLLNNFYKVNSVPFITVIYTHIEFDLIINNLFGI